MLHTVQLDGRRLVAHTHLFFQPSHRLCRRSPVGAWDLSRNNVPFIAVTAYAKLVTLGARSAAHPSYCCARTNEAGSATRMAAHGCLPPWMTCDTGVKRSRSVGHQDGIVRRREPRQ